MDSPSRDRRPLGRRNVLRMLAFAPVVGVVAGCGAEQKEPDALAALVEAARSDVKLAEKAARAHPVLAAPSELLTSVRTEHARALQREIDRLDPPDPDEPAPKPPAAPRVPDTADAAANALREALRNAQEKATDLTPTLSSYRAGLVGSVSASCASLLEVLG